jgi:phenylacetate-CoA ligase
VRGLKQYQIVQRRADEVSVRVVPDGAFSEETPRAIRAALAGPLPGLTVQVEVVEAIPREPSGKFRIVRNDLNDRPR